MKVYLRKEIRCYLRCVVSRSAVSMIGNNRSNNSLGGVHHGSPHLCERIPHRLDSVQFALRFKEIRKIVAHIATGISCKMERKASTPLPLTTIGEDLVILRRRSSSGMLRSHRYDLGATRCLASALNGRTAG